MPNYPLTHWKSRVIMETNQTEEKKMKASDAMAHYEYLLESGWTETYSHMLESCNVWMMNLIKRGGHKNLVTIKYITVYFSLDQGEIETTHLDKDTLRAALKMLSH